MRSLEGAVQTKKPSVPIIAVTAYAYDSDRAKALDVGCDDYIAKPLTGDVLKKKLRKHLKEDDSIEIINIHGKGYKLITPEND